MIQVTVTHVQGIELAVNRVIAIDPEKIVDARRRGIFTEIDYAESYDRKWETITYQVTAALPNIQAAIHGDWTTNTYLSVTVFWGEPREMCPNIWRYHYDLDIQEKFIVDIEEVLYKLPWWPSKVLLTKLRFTSSAFLQKVVYVTQHLHDLVPDVPSDTTTTTTEEPVTTTTELPVTTTTEEHTTTTTDDGLCHLYTITVSDQQLPLTFRIYPCEDRCQEEFTVVVYGQPATVCSCFIPTIVGGGTLYNITKGAVCGEETTTTTPVPELTTTTTWPDLCQDVWYNGTLSAGVEGVLSGYSTGEGGIGTLIPLNNDIMNILHNTTTKELALGLQNIDCYTSAYLYVDGNGYELTMTNYEGGVGTFILEGLLTSPFPPEGVCNIQICFGDACTTTTTPEGV